MYNKIPQSWDDVSIEQFIEIFNLKQDDFSSTNRYYLNLLAILTNSDIDDMEYDLEYDEFLQIVNSLYFLNTTPYTFAKPSLNTKAGKLYFIDIDKITMGEFIDLENLCVDGYIKNIKLLLTILYRQKTFNDSLLFLDEYEPYGNWIHHRAKLFNGLSINEVYGSIMSYLKFRANIYEQYHGLFNMEDDEAEDTSEEDLSNMSMGDRNAIRRAEDREKTVKKWGFDVLLLRLAKNDPTKIEKSTSLPLVLALNYLSMQQELDMDL